MTAGKVTKNNKKEFSDFKEIREFLARPSGFEPLAFRLGGGRSILLSYGRIRGLGHNRRRSHTYENGVSPKPAARAYES